MTRESEQAQEALPAYELGAELGRGTWGIVHRARHRETGRVVAVKQLALAYAADAEVRKRFRREARVLATLDHPHIVAFHDFVAQDDVCLIVLDYEAGGDLVSRLGPPGGADVEAVGLLDRVCIGLALCAALDAAHVRAIVHRDVKPANVLFDERNVLKLADFGLAKSVGGPSSITASGVLLGTPSYMAPEQILGREATTATDVFAAGVVLHRLFGGVLPTASPAMSSTVDPDEVVGASLDALAARVNVDPLPLCALVPDVPAPLGAVVDRAIARDPGARYATAGAMGAALRNAGRDLFGDVDVRIARYPVLADLPDGDPGDAIVAAMSPPAVEQASVVTQVRAPASVALQIHEPGGIVRRVMIEHVTTVGRSEADLIVADAEVSRCHARLTPTNAGSVLVEDLASSNGSFVDGARITEPTPLLPRGWLDLGATRIVLADAPPPGWGSDRTASA